MHLVCLDKTGSITTNRMRVGEVATGSRRWRSRPDASLERSETSQDFRALLETAVVCSDVTVMDAADGLQIEESATEMADLARPIKTGGKADLASVTFGALMAGALVQAFRGQLLPASVTMLAYAMRLVPGGDRK